MSNFIFNNKFFKLRYIIDIFFIMNNSNLFFVILVKMITNKTFINKLESIIDSRISSEYKNSYIKSLYEKGVKEIAKKVTEEAGETAISAVTKDGRLIEESADLLFHLAVLLKNQGFSFEDVLDELKSRNINQ